MENPLGYKYYLNEDVIKEVIDITYEAYKRAELPSHFAHRPR